MKKRLFVLLIISFLYYSGFSQESDKSVVLTVTGQGNTIDIARTNALRSAIEQAFGAFISTKTEVLNDSIVKDDIISVSNGNIQRYEIINEPKTENGLFTSIIKATVSINKLTNYCAGKGISIEFKGGLFAQNMAMQELYESSEKNIWDNIKPIFYNLIKNSFDYKLEVSAPMKNGENYNIGFDIYVEANKTFDTALSFLRKFCKSISLDEISASEYLKAGKEIFPISFPKKSITSNNCWKKKVPTNNKIETFLFRNRDVANSIISLPWEVAKSATYNFKIINGFDEIYLNKFGGEIRIEGGGNIAENGNFKKEFSGSYSGDEIIGYVISGDLQRFYQLFSWTIFGGGFKWSGNISKYGLQRFKWVNSSEDNYSLFSKKEKDFYGNIYSRNPFELNPIFNLVNSGPFLKIHINDNRNIEEIKKMKEFSVIPSN